MLSGQPTLFVRPQGHPRHTRRSEMDDPGLDYFARNIPFEEQHARWRLCPNLCPPRNPTECYGVLECSREWAWNPCLVRLS